MSGKFELTKSEKGQFHFHLKAGNGEIILSSEMYESKQAALNGIASVQTNAPHEERFDRKTNKADKPYFNLKAANHQIIGSSQAYTSEESRDKGIESVKKNGVTTTIEDLTV